MPEVEDVALFDLDATLCDYDRQILEDLERLRSPYEPQYTATDLRNEPTPEYMSARMQLIKSSSRWWANLPRFSLGWDVLHAAQGLDFKIVILTQTPRLNPAASKGKQEWVLRELGDSADIELTRNKHLVYGKVLVDDFPQYVDAWLEHRKNGLAILPANVGNVDYRHPNAIRYDGSNLAEVQRALAIAKARIAGEPLRL